MSPPRGRRTQDCGLSDGRTRLAQARKFLEVAELVAGEAQIPESLSTAAALAALAGIAASDAACCTALGQRSRSASHHDAETLLERIAPDGPAAARHLRRLQVFTKSVGSSASAFPVSAPPTDERAAALRRS